MSRGERDFLQGWFSNTHNNDLESLSLKDILTYAEAKYRIVNLPSNYHSLSGASSKNSKPHHEAHTLSSLNGKQNKI
jgi:hypothetical protein